MRKRPSHVRRVGLASLFLLLAAIAAEPAVADRPVEPVAPPTLTGETFLENFSGSQLTPRFEANCNPQGTSTFSFTVSGVAAGPYPGVFRESGIVRIGPQTLPDLPPVPGTEIRSSRGFNVGPVLSFEAHFEIDSLVGQVTGRKQLVVELPSNLGACVDFENVMTEVGRVGSGFIRDARAVVSYEATIVTATGRFVDRGTSSVFMQDYRASFAGGGGAASGVFLESFVSSLVATEPLLVPPGNSPLLQPGRGCGDANHLHIRREECRTR